MNIDEIQRIGNIMTQALRDIASGRYSDSGHTSDSIGDDPLSDTAHEYRKIAKKALIKIGLL